MVYRGKTGCGVLTRQVGGNTVKKGCILWPFGLVVLAIAVSAFVLGFAGGSHAIEEGATAPLFALPDQHGKTHSLADYRGRWVVLAFYPADMTSGCTLQNRSLTASLDDLTALGAAVFAISVQDSASHAKFCDAEGLKHTLLADTGKTAAKDYGVLLPAGVAKRVTFVINPEGAIARRLDPVSVQSHGPDVVALLQDLGAGSDGKAESTAPPRGVRTLRPGSKAPLFNLPDSARSGLVALSDLQSGNKGAVVVWVSAQCPVSGAYQERIKSLAARFKPQGIAFVAIDSNTTESRDQVAAHFRKAALGFPVLVDVNNTVADLYGAAVTPEAFLVDRSGIIRYHGAIDDSRDAAAVKKSYLADALTAFLAGEEIRPNEVKSFGCSVKRAKK